MTALTFFDVTGDFHAVTDPDISSASSDANVEAVQGLVHFVPRLPVGFVAYLDEYAISANANAKQTLTLIGAITGGTWGLNFNGVWTNPYINAGASAAAVQSALAALSTIGSGNVSVTGPAGGPYQVQFIGALAASRQTQMLADASDLDVSSGTPHVSVVVTVPGSAARTDDVALALPPRTGRIWTTGQLCSINVADSPNVELTANVNLGIDFDLIYDVSYTAVRFADASRALAPFAFVAPTTATPVCITDPALQRLPYSSPLQEMWYPGWAPGLSLPPARSNVTVLRPNDWRARSA